MCFLALGNSKQGLRNLIVFPSSKLDQQCFQSSKRWLYQKILPSITPSCLPLSLFTSFIVSKEYALSKSFPLIYPFVQEPGRVRQDHVHKLLLTLQYFVH